MRFLFILTAYLLGAFFVYGKLLSTFFQQDEWAIFGNFIYWDKAGLSWFGRLFTDQYTHLIPLGNIVSYIQFRVLGVIFFGYGISSILLHFFNASLVYYLAHLLIKKRSIAFLSGSLFLLNAIPRQSVIWVATTAGTMGSTFFVLITLIFAVQYVQREKKRYLFTSLLFLVISLLFKETSIFLFLFLPIFFLLFKKKHTPKAILKVFSPFLLVGIFYLAFRLFFRLFFILNTNVINSAPEFFSQPNFFVYIYRILTVPFKTLAQSIFPVDYIIIFARNLIQLAYPQFVSSGVPDPYIVQSVASDLISYSIAILILIICGASIIFFRRLKENGQSRVITASLLFIFLSSIPLIIIPGRAGYFSLIDGRHLYVTSIFASILLASIGWTFYSLNSKKLSRATILLILVLFLGLNALQIRKDLNIQMANAYIRKSILNKITRDYPSLPENIIFYTESDKAYYGLADEEKILPFQSGFGQTLLVWYNMHGEKFPSCFFKGKYLYTLLEENYKECEGRGFGYYRKLDSLKAGIVANKLNPDQVLAFKFYSQTNKLEDITKEVRKKIQQ